MLHKVLKIVAIILSLAGVVSLIMIIAAGDDAIETGEKAHLVDPIAYIGYITLAIVLGFVVFFVIKNTFNNPAGLKNTLIGIGAFLAVLVISYVVSGGDDMQYRLEDNIYASEGTSQMVGAGLTAFYILIIVAVVSMLFSGVKKVISK